MRTALSVLNELNRIEDKQTQLLKRLELKQSQQNRDDIGTAYKILEVQRKQLVWVLNA